MTSHQLIQSFYDDHKKISDYILALPEEAFMYSHEGKWTAGQQLKHVYLTLLPFPKILPSKDFIRQKFGTIDRPTRDYDTVIKNYFLSSRQAPSVYLPEHVSPEQKTELAANLEAITTTIQNLLQTYSEEELDTLVIPHPLLGKMTIREMYYLMTYHPTHHLRQTQAHIKKQEFIYRK